MKIQFIYPIQEGRERTYFVDDQRIVPPGTFLVAKLHLADLQAEIVNFVQTLGDAVLQVRRATKEQSEQNKMGPVAFQYMVGVVRPTVIDIAFSKDLINEWFPEGAAPATGSAIGWHKNIVGAFLQALRAKIAEAYPGAEINVDDDAGRFGSNIALLVAFDRNRNGEHVEKVMMLIGEVLAQEAREMEYQRTGNHPLEWWQHAGFTSGQRR